MPDPLLHGQSGSAWDCPCGYSNLAVCCTKCGRPAPPPPTIPGQENIAMPATNAPLLGNSEGPLNPPATVLVKLGSIARHWEEYTSATGHSFDADALKALLADPEVQEWMAAMDGLALLPVKR